MSIPEELSEIQDRVNIHDFGDTYQLADEIMKLAQIVGQLLARIEKLEAHGKGGG